MSGPNYFAGMGTVADIKLAYRKLCSIHHPDKGGNTAKMQEVNVQYHARLKSRDGEKTTGTDNKERTYHYYAGVEQAIMDMIYKLVGLDMVDVDVMLIGTWIWVEGNTRPYSKVLGKQGGLGLDFHRQRGCWYWHLPSKRRQRFNKSASLAEIASHYGYKRFEAQQEERERQKVFGK